MTRMDRRAFVRHVVGSAGAGVSIAAGGQQPAPQPGAADPLPQPNWINGTRRVVDSADNDGVVKQIERRLHCTCGCGLDVFTCRTTDFTCTYSPALHDEVVGLLRDRRDSNTVIATLVAKYGESILMAPKAQGFGVIGYTLPGALIVGAGVLLTWVLVRRARRRRPFEPVATPALATSTTPAELDRLERALRELEP